MRTEIGEYRKNRNKLKLGNFIFLSIVISVILCAELSIAIGIIFFSLLVLVGIIFNKKIIDLKRSPGYYTVSFDKELLYCTDSCHEIQIPIENITAIKLEDFSTSGTNSWLYKIVYTRDIGVENIRLEIPYDNRQAFNRFEELVQYKNPGVQIITMFPSEIDFTWLDKGTRLINKVSEKIFKPKK